MCQGRALSPKVSALLFGHSTLSVPIAPWGCTNITCSELDVFNVWGRPVGSRRMLGTGKGAEIKPCALELALESWCCLCYSQAFPEAALQFAPLSKVKSWSKESQTKSEEWIHLQLFFFFLRGLCILGFPIKAGAGQELFLSPQGTWIAFVQKSDHLSSEKMQSVFSSAESKIGAFLKLKASNLRRVY